MTQPPWLVPVPVRPSQFVPISPDFAAYNVEVALDRLRPFVMDDAAETEVLQSDLQTNLDSNAPGRFGAGRAGFFRNRYLKGVGRTLLAGNWNDVGDRYHGSGHLSISSMLREFLSTAILRRRGAGHTIVGSEGVLVRRLEEQEKEAIQKDYRKRVMQICPADGALAGISVRGGNFGRISNVVWGLEHLGETPEEVGVFFRRWKRLQKGWRLREKKKGIRRNSHPFCMQDLRRDSPTMPATLRKGSTGSLFTTIPPSMVDF